MKIACTPSVTNVECEHSTSSWRFLKTYLCSCIGEAWLNGLAMLFIHPDIAAMWKSLWMKLHDGTLEDYNDVILSMLTNQLSALVAQYYLITAVD